MSNTYLLSAAQSAVVVAALLMGKILPMSEEAARLLALKLKMGKSFKSSLLSIQIVLGVSTAEMVESNGHPVIKVDIFIWQRWKCNEAFIHLFSAENFLC